MTMTPPSTEPRLELGFVYPAYEIVVTPEHQRRKHALAGVDSDLFGDAVDITFLAYESILAGRRAGVSVNGNVHMAQVFRQREPIRLGEPVEIRGRVTAVEPVAKGDVITSEFELVRPDGSVPLVAERCGLRLDPAKAGGAGRGGANPAPADAGDGMVELDRKQLVPERVAEYSVEAENLIHSDPEVARRFGYRAPIAAGLMAAHYVLEALLRRGPITALDMEMRFLRPMFWDDALRILGREADGRLAEVAVLGPAGKALGRATVARAA